MEISSSVAFSPQVQNHLNASSSQGTLKYHTEEGGKLRRIRIGESFLFLPVLGVFIGAIRTLTGTVEISVGFVTFPFQMFWGFERLSGGLNDCVYGMFAILSGGMMTYLPELN